MEDLFDEKLLEAIRLAEALQDGQSEEKESEGKKTEVKQETENSRPVSRTEEPAAAPVPQTGEEAVDQLIKEIVQETQEEIAEEGRKSETGKEEAGSGTGIQTGTCTQKAEGSMEPPEKDLCDPACCDSGCDRDPCRYICKNVYEWKEPAGRKCAGRKGELSY